MLRGIQQKGKASYPLALDQMTKAVPMMETHRPKDERQRNNQRLGRNNSVGAPFSNQRAVVAIADSVDCLAEGSGCLDALEHFVAILEIPAGGLEIRVVETRRTVVGVLAVAVVADPREGRTPAGVVRGAARPGFRQRGEMAGVSTHRHENGAPSTVPSSRRVEKRFCQSRHDR